MIAIEEYITQRKKKDKLDEFDFQKHSENMAKVIQYVTEYFNEYLNLEDYNYEQVKMQQAVNKFKDSIMEKYPTMYDFIISYYWDNKKRLDSIVEKTFNSFKDSELFYLSEDYESVAEDVCRKLNLPIDKEFFDKVIMIAKEYHDQQSVEPSISDMKELDNALVDWVKAASRQYNIDLLEFARNISYHYYEHYVDTEYDHSTETFYHINKYDYRYQENPFDINDIYARNEHREFIKDHKGELEMLIMYYWLFEDVCDSDYWPEYVSLCISTGRVKLVKNKRVLLPVQVKGLPYPCEIEPNIQYIETSTGIFEYASPNYVLRITYDNNNDLIWKDKEVLSTIIKNLQNSFKKYGAPELLEFMSPYKTAGYEPEEFFENYQIFEKGMRNYSKMKIAMINGYMKAFKGKDFLFSTAPDLARLKNTCKEYKLKLKLSVDFTDNNGKNVLKKNMDDTINSLAVMRSFIVGIHLNNIDSWGRYRDFYRNDKRHECININEYPTLSTFMYGLSTIIQDSKPRYFIPDSVKNSDALEILVDTLYRSGCIFEKEVTYDEK